MFLNFLFSCNYAATVFTTVFSIRLVVYFSKLVFNLKAASLVIGIQNSSAR